MNNYLKILCLALFVNMSCPLCCSAISNDTLLPVAISFLNEGKTVMLNAKGNSMRPFIKDGEKVLLERCQKYKTNDIVLAHLPNGMYVLHRIDSLTNSIVTLMGDGNLQGKEYCPFDSLKAICRAKFDSVGNKIAFDTEVQNNKVIMWKRCIDYRQELLSSFCSNDENTFWTDLFQCYITHKSGKLSIRSSFDSRKINDGTFILFSSESTNVDFSALITFNETADYVFSHMKGRTFSFLDCVNDLMSIYEIDNTTCKKDCINLLTNWFSMGILNVE